MFGNASTSAGPGLGGFSFGTTPGTTTASNPAAGGFSFGNTQAGSTTLGTAASLPGGGFSFGNQAPSATTAAAAGFSLAGALDSSQGAPKAVRFDAGIASTQATNQVTSGQLGVGGLGTTTAQNTAGSTLAGLLSGNKPTLSLGQTTAATTAASGVGFSLAPLGTAAAAASNTFGATTTTTTTSLGFGIGGASSAAPATSNIFGVATASTARQGLGGLDPKAISSPAGASGGASKSCDGKALRETPVDPIIVNSVEEFLKHVKQQKIIRENISRMSSKPICKVKEEMRNLQQQLMLVSNGLQKNATAIEKLKKETVQELKCAEMAQRTKDTPPGLQFENTAPTEYFHRLMENFELQMMLYRQQILDTENHLLSLNNSAMLTPQELSTLFTKLNEGFTALASQLQVIHEAVTNQKEQYLEFRKVYHGDTKDIFVRRKKVQDSISKCVPSTIGPTPFCAVLGIGSLAASTHAGISQEPQQHTGAAFGGLSTAGAGFFGGAGSTAGGATSLTAAPTLSVSPSTATTQTQKPFTSKRGKNA